LDSISSVSPSKYLCLDEKDNRGYEGQGDERVGDEREGDEREGDE
jgi:hypothetical protein